MTLHNSSRHRRHIAAFVRLAGAAVVVPALAACQRQAAPPQGRGTHAYVSYHDQPTAKRFTAFAKALGWPGGDVTEYSDAQRLDDATGTGSTREYGPVVRVAAIDNLDAYTTPGDFTTARRVALLYIARDGSDPMPKRYAEQGWAFDFTCIYLRHAGSNPRGGWSFGLAPAATARDCPVSPPAGVTWNTKVARIAPEADPAMYPVTARLEETNSGAPVIGLRCGTAWCYLGVADEHNVRKPDMGGFVDKRAAIPGWLDDQELADVDASARRKLRPGMRATILSQVPNGKLDLSAYQSGDGMRVAEIYIPPGNIPTKYADRGLKSGLNSVWLRHDPALPATDGWSAAYNPASGAKWYVVHYTNLDPSPVPHVVRWGWSDDDETIWAACYTGCCEVTDGLY